MHMTVIFVDFVLVWFVKKRRNNIQCERHNINLTDMMWMYKIVVMRYVST